MDIHDSERRRSGLQDIFETALFESLSDELKHDTFVSTRQPPYDILYGEDEIIVIMELYGYDENSISAYADGNMITIKAEKRDANDNGIDMDSMIDSYEISIPLTVSRGKCTHSYNDGVVEVHAKMMHAENILNETYL